jgi:asparagine synthase (glutamine-hydrolysing)
MMCRFQQFPPGHYYDSKTKEFTRYYNPKFYLDFEAQPPVTPSTPYDPVVSRWGQIWGNYLNIT